MRDRVEQLVGRMVRRDVGDDVPLRLRAHPARRGGAPRLHAALLDLRRGRLACGSCAAAWTSSASTRSASRRARSSRRSRARRTSSRTRPPTASSVGSFFEQTVADVYELYEKRIHEMNAVDFDDLLFRTVNLLELFPDVAERYRRTFRWILVDEYQDTNHAQYRLLQLLAGEERNVCVVGDDDQSIYGFRGADINNILDFERDFPGAHVVKLEQNYRSTQTILSAANAVVSHNEGRKPKQLWTDARRGRAGARRRARGRARRGALRGRRDRAPARRGGHRARRRRGLLPDQRAEPRARGHARALRRRLPGDRRHEVLRARRDQGRARLPDAAGQPERHRLVRAGRQLAQARHRPDDRRPRARAREHDGRAGHGDRGGARAGPRARSRRR